MSQASQRIASFRMYEAGAGARHAWRILAACVFDDADADIAIVEHAWPQPIATLWEDPALNCGFMCGFPFVRSTRAMQPLAAPVPAPPRYARLPRYCSEFLVHTSLRATNVRETFGHRFGWMAENSQSGFNAPRAFLASYARPRNASLFAQSSGPHDTPVRLLSALQQEEVDVIAVDGFYLDLLRHHEPSRLAGLRSIGQTPWTPIPLLVAAPEIEPDVVSRLRLRLTTLHEEAAYRPLLEEVLVERFVDVDREAYRLLDAMATFAAARSYPSIQ